MFPLKEIISLNFHCRDGYLTAYCMQRCGDGVAAFPSPTTPTPATEVCPSAGAEQKRTRMDLWLCSTDTEGTYWLMRDSKTEELCPLPAKRTRPWHIGIPFAAGSAFEGTNSANCNSRSSWEKYHNIFAALSIRFT